MARSIWKKTLVTSLAWAGLAWAQQPPYGTRQPASPTLPATMTERTLTVQEPGKPAQKCQVIKTWKTPEGTTAYQVRVMATGEMMTIVENGPVTTVPGSRPGTRLQAITTRIFHWGQSTMPPTGTPLPPLEGAQTRPAPVMHQEVVSEVVQQPKPAARFLPRFFNRNKEEVSTVMPESSSSLPASSYSSSYSSVPTTTITSVTTPNASPTTMNAPIVQTQTVPADKLRATTVSSVTTPSASPTTMNVRPVQMQTATADSPGALEAKAPLTPPWAAPAGPAPTAAEPTDWRRSWGKADDHRSRLIPRIVPIRDKDESKEATTGSKQPDPLQAPDHYRGSAIESKHGTGKDDVSKEEKRHSTFSAWLAAHRESANKAAEPGPASVSREATQQMNSGTVPGTSQKVPLGAASIMAAGQAAQESMPYVAMPVVTLPDLAHPPTPPLANVPQPPQPFARQGYGDGSMVSRALGSSPTTTDPAMANAFMGTPTRDTVALSTNAFSSGPSAGMATATVDAPMYPPNPYAQMAQQMPASNGAMPVATPVVAAGYQAPATGTVGNAKAQSLSDLVSMLHDSLYPSQREQAAATIARYDWRANPQAVNALVAAAQDDPAPTVRMRCVHCLSRMRANTAPVLKAVRALQVDPDPRVRQEAEQAQRVLAPAPVRK